MTGTARRTLLALAALLALAVAGCTQTVAGRGTARNTSPSSSSSSSTDSSSDSSSSSSPTQFSCPTVHDTASLLTYSCIASGMKFQQDPLWPVNVAINTESTWQMAEGSGRIGPTSKALKTLALTVVGAMIDGGSYGTSPTDKTVSAQDTTINGSHKAHVLQTLITLNPTYRKAQKLKVSAERLWVVLIETSPGTVSAFYITVPNTVSKYWAAVPKLIGAIKVG